MKNPFTYRRRSLPLPSSPRRSVGGAEVNFYHAGFWAPFLPVVLVVMFSFTVALPLSISMYLRYHRYELYSTRIFQKVGFLYQPYRRGSEFWQIHDVVFKMVLTGVSTVPCLFCKPHLAPPIILLFKLFVLCSYLTQETTLLHIYRVHIRCSSMFLHWSGREWRS